jgi:hypothetical protein
MTKNTRRGSRFEGLRACLGEEEKKRATTAKGRGLSITLLLLRGEAIGDKGLASGETRNMNHQRAKLWNVWSS